VDGSSISVFAERLAGLTVTVEKSPFFHIYRLMVTEYWRPSTGRFIEQPMILFAGISIRISETLVQLHGE
jgi:hypothetical protein